MGMLRPQSYQQFFDIGLTQCFFELYATGDLITLPFEEINYVDQNNFKNIKRKPISRFCFRG